MNNELYEKQKLKQKESIQQMKLETKLGLNSTVLNSSIASTGLNGPIGPHLLNDSKKTVNGTKLGLNQPKTKGDMLSSSSRSTNNSNSDIKSRNRSNARNASKNKPSNELQSSLRNGPRMTIEEMNSNAVNHQAIDLHDLSQNYRRPMNVLLPRNETLSTRQRIGDAGVVSSSIGEKASKVSYINPQFNAEFQGLHQSYLQTQPISQSFVLNHPSYDSQRQSLRQPTQSVNNETNDNFTYSSNYESKSNATDEDLRSVYMKDGNYSDDYTDYSSHNNVYVNSYGKDNVNNYTLSQQQQFQDNYQNNYLLNIQVDSLPIDQLNQQQYDTQQYSNDDQQHKQQSHSYDIYDNQQLDQQFDEQYSNDQVYNTNNNSSAQQSYDHVYSQSSQNQLYSHQAHDTEAYNQYNNKSNNRHSNSNSYINDSSRQKLSSRSNQMHSPPPPPPPR